MVFQVRKWGWKRLASKLLLIPVLTGGLATVVQAQQPATAATQSSGSGWQTQQGPPNDPKMLLEEGRKALAAGDFGRALDLSRQAEANNKGNKWGLFDDTPNALRKDIKEAEEKAKKAESEKLTKKAKELFAAPTTSDMQRASNLDQAFQMAQRADFLHGPYSAWDLGDRADKLMKEIQAARSRLNVATPAGPQASTTNQPPANTPAGAMASRTSTTDTKKAAAMQLMADAKKLADQEMFGPAREKLNQANRIGANFGVNELSPAIAIQELNVRGSRAIDRRIAEAKAQMAKKDFAKADMALNDAAEVAASLGLYARPIDDTRAQLRNAAGGKLGGPAPAAVAAAPSTSTAPVFPTPSGPNGLAIAPRASTVPAVSSAPSAPIPPFVPGVPNVPTTTGTQAPGVAILPGTTAQPVTTPVTPVTAKELLHQADIEFTHGNLEVAEKLAEKAHNLGAHEEARRLLNSIDVERLKFKTIQATRSFENAQTSFKNKEYDTCLRVLVLVDPLLLTAEQKAKREELLTICQGELKKDAAIREANGVATTGGTQTGEPQIQPPVTNNTQPSPGINPPATALTSPPVTALPSDPKTSPDSFANQVEALRKVQFQKLRTEGNKIMTESQAAWGRGEADFAIQLLNDYAARVRAANLEPASTAMLLRPIDSRLDQFNRMRVNAIAIARLNQENKDAREHVGRSIDTAEDQRRAEVKELFEKCRNLMKKQQYAEAEKVALQAKQLDPDNPACTALAEMAKLTRAVKDAEKLKDDKEKMFRLGLNNAEGEGPLVTVENPVSFVLDRARNSRARGSGDNLYQRTHSPAEYEIQLKLNNQIQVDFKQTPLDQAVEYLKSLTSIPMIIDLASLESEGISPVKPVTVNPGHSIAAKHMLAVTLEQAGLSYVIEHDMIKITTLKKAKGRLFTKVFSVADLVTPVPNFALPDYANFSKMMAAGTGNYGTRNLQIGGSSTPFMPPNQLGGGTPLAPGVNATSPGISMPSPGQGGTLQSTGWTPENPLKGSATLAGETNTKHEQLMKLITGMVRPYSWDGMGGPGRVEYYDIGSALVVNQTADVIQEVADLLEALRRLQDLAIAVELRIVSLSESWFERMGVDFSVNILTNTTKFQPSLTTVDPNTGAAGVFAPIPYINSIGNVGTTVGLTPAGTFTPDLNVPIQNSSFAMAIPPFGGYPNTPGADGGVSLGLAFLNDIQVYLFMEAAAGDRRVNVMQAPKLTLFNGQTASIQINNLQFFVTSVQVISVNGQIVFSPIATPFPGPGDPLGLNGQQPGQVDVTIQGVVSADRRFVRLNLPITMAAQTGTTVPLFPITTFVTPVFEGGSQGQPIPFTQFLQQPAFTDLTINTTVVCPDGGTVLLGGFKQLSEGRNEFGPPFLSDIPYLSRLFKNVGIGRETTHIMIMVTPRIIINSEEEIRQTETATGP